MPCVLDQPVLVLNKNWTAIDVKPVREAVGNVCTENAVFINPEDFQEYTWERWAELMVREGEPFIATGSQQVRVPDVIVLKHYSRVHAEILVFNRRNLFLRDQNTCQYCGKRSKSSECSIDHVLPQCQGGPSTWENCVLACVTCNVRKGGRTPKQANMKLVRTPVKPRWSPTFRARVIKPIWGKFGVNIEALVSDLYWQVQLEE